MPVGVFGSCKSLKIWPGRTSASHKTTFSELSRRPDLNAFKCLSVEVGIQRDFESVWPIQSRFSISMSLKMPQGDVGILGTNNLT